MPGLRAKPSSPSGKRTTRCHSFHLDHIASLPYLTEKTNFKGRVFMTHASKAIGLLLIKEAGSDVKLITHHSKNSK